MLEFSPTPRSRPGLTSDGRAPFRQRALGLSQIGRRYNQMVAFTLIPSAVPSRTMTVRRMSIEIRNPWTLDSRDVSPPLVRNPLCSGPVRPADEPDSADERSKCVRAYQSRRGPSTLVDQIWVLGSMMTSPIRGNDKWLKTPLCSTAGTTAISLIHTMTSIMKPTTGAIQCLVLR
jgi:hypothetical protein